MLNDHFQTCNAYVSLVYVSGWGDKAPADPMPKIQGYTLTVGDDRIEMVTRDEFDRAIVERDATIASLRAELADMTRMAKLASRFREERNAALDDANAAFAEGARKAAEWDDCRQQLHAAQVEVERLKALLPKAPPPAFKVGDRVRFACGTGAVRGRVGTIAKDHWPGVSGALPEWQYEVAVDGHNVHCNAWHLEPVPPAPEPPDIADCDCRICRPH